MQEKMTEKKQLILYLAIAYGLAWICEGAMVILYACGILPENGGVVHYVLIALFCGMAPTYAAFIVKYKAGVKIRDMIREDGIWRSKEKNIMLLLIFALLVLAMNAFLETKNEWPWYITPVVFVTMIFGGGLEEVGWRSIMQPVLFKKLPFFLAVIVQGIAWSIWHLPLWFVKNTSQSSMSFLAFTIYCLVMCLELSVLYWATESVLTCVCFHAEYFALGAPSIHS